MNIRTRVNAADVRQGDTLATHTGAPVVQRITTSKKGKVLAWVGRGEPVILEGQVWVLRAPISQAPSA